VLALRSLCAIDPDSTPRVAEIARACGDHLLSKVQTTPSGIGWFCGDPNGPPLTGYAHGNAGIAAALIEIAALTGEPRFRDTALAAFAYERALFSPQEGNWPDLRPYAGGGFTMAWCHGAPGIGLSRLCTLRHMPDDTLRKELSIALATTAERGFGANYCICHGDLGNAELLLQFAQTTRESQWAERAKRVAAGVISDARRTGWICGNPLGVESPGLMTGLAGMGHMMLRMAEPEGVASALTLEPPNVYGFGPVVVP
jgi:lantibiotic modifying enzyme